MNFSKISGEPSNLNILKDVGAGDDLVDDEEMSTITFETLLTRICFKFACQYSVYVVKEYYKDDFIKANKSDASLKRQKTNSKISKHSISPNIATEIVNEPDSVIVSAIYDHNDCLIEICISKASHIPRLVMQGIGLLAPYLDCLKRVTIKRSCINVYTIQELQETQSRCCLTEIVLEDAVIPEGPYALLLDRNLRNLTLCRCEIDDHICEQISKRLSFSEDSEVKLQTLNLTSNYITDAGAKHLAEALRTNRTLRSLNLADNQISDQGVIWIMTLLREFPLTKDELMAERLRHFEYLTKQAKIVNETRKPQETKGNLMHLKTIKKPVMIADQLMKPFEGPFIKAHTVMKNNKVYCRGNLVLASLNLSYNKLSYFCLKDIEKTMVYQQNNKKISESGLIRLIIEGNNLPETCSELEHITNIINSNLISVAVKNQSAKQKK